MATPDAAVAGEAVPSSTTAIKHIAMDMEAIFAIARYNLRLSFFFFLSFFLEFKGHAPALALTKTKRLQSSNSSHDHSSSAGNNRNLIPPPTITRAKPIWNQPN